MTERERMIKLVAEMRLAAKGTIGSMNDPDAWCADYLLERGVIVFPCNVGAPVYVLTPNKQRYYKTRAFPLATLAKWVQNGDFGKHVFTTREAAEAVLAERR